VVSFVAILTTSLSLLASPQTAAATGATAGECTLNLQLTFSPALKATAQTNIAINVNGSMGSCVQAPAIALCCFGGGSMGAAVGSCEAMEANGLMYFSPIMQATVLSTGALQVWQMQSVNPPLQTFGVAEMNWLNVSEVNACRSSTGTSTMTLTGVITFEDPTTS
jgi:hypothetical protein